MSLVLAPGQALYLTTGTPATNQALAMASFAVPGGAPNSALAVGTGTTPVMLAQAVYGSAPTVVSSLQVFNPDTAPLSVKLTVQTGSGTPIVVYENASVPANGEVCYEGSAGWQLLVAGIPTESPQFPAAAANTVYAGPASGSAALPAFRALATADIPELPLSNLSPIAADTLVANATSGSASPTAVSLGAGLGFSGGALASTVQNQGLRNFLINATGQINQRGYVSGTATTSSGQYTVDRWKVVTSGQNLSWTNSGGVATFTAPAGGVSQVVEAANIQGGSYVLSWTGTATATVNGSSVTNGVPFTLSANAAATVTFSNGTFSLPQLEYGTYRTRFDWRFFAVELGLCSRYCQVISTAANNAFVMAVAYSSTGAIGYLYLPTPMRTSPTGATTGIVTMTPPGTGVAGTGSITVVPVSNQIMALLVSLTGLTIGSAGYFSAVTNPQVITLSAEL